jgi:hypothetical protein
MTDKFIEIEFEDEHDVIAGLWREEREKRQLAKELIEDIGEAGLKFLEFNVPQSSTYLWRHTAKSDAKFRSGGAGGGGEYEVIVGIKAGTSRHPLYVEGGTGIYGPRHDLIYPRFAARMTWFSTIYNKLISRKTTRGQKPQRYFYETWKEVEVYARMQLLTRTINPLR